MSKLTEEDKAKIIKHYLNSFDGYKATADKFGINKATVRMIILRYQQSGSSTIIKKQKQYDTRFKIHVLKYQKEHSLSNFQTCIKFDIPTTSLLRNWQKKYSTGGYNLLDRDKRGAPKDMNTKDKADTKSELERLREENEYLRMENDILKKLKALIHSEEKSEPSQKHELSEN